MAKKNSINTLSAFAKALPPAIGKQTKALPKPNNSLSAERAGMSLHLWENPSLRRRLWRKSAYKYK